MKERARTKLLERWTDLVASRALLAEALQQLGGLQEPDISDAGLARVDAELAGELDDRRLRELLDVAAAVERLESGGFGQCVRCGADIDTTRLVAMPWVPTCLGCAHLEKTSRVNGSASPSAAPPWLEQLPEEPRILRERELDESTTARPRGAELRWDAAADTSEEPIEIARRALEEATEAPAAASGLTAEYPQDLVYEPDELLDDHLRFDDEL